MNFLEKNLSATPEKSQRFSFREQLRKLGLGLALATSISGCCASGCNPFASTEGSSSSEPSVESILSRYRDAGSVDAGVARPSGSTSSVSSATDAGADAALYQGTPEFIAERERCYAALPHHACLDDDSEVDTTGHVTRVSHSIELSPAFAAENHHTGTDRFTARDQLCELVDADGTRRFIFEFTHDGYRYSCNYHNTAGVDLSFHRLVPCTRRGRATSNPCPPVR